MVVVGDASVLINLAWLGKLSLLEALFGELFVPRAVWDEIVERGAGKPGSAEIRAAAWVKVGSVANTPLVRVLQQYLDAGEAEAIALALEMDADLLLMDERLGRSTAHHLGLKLIGVIGILVLAKERDHLAAIKPELDYLRQVAGFYISESLYQRVLQDTGEV